MPEIIDGLFHLSLIKQFRIMEIETHGIAVPRVQPIAEPATITEVLLEVVDGSDAHLAGQPVVDFLDDVILSLGDQFFYVSCIHWHYLGIAVKSAISRK